MMTLFKSTLAACLFFSLLFFAEAKAQRCLFTYEQGVAVGCAMAQAANNADCYSTDCWSLYDNTINDFAQHCPDYARGVAFGFAQCNQLPAWQNNSQGKDPLDTGNNIIDPPCEGAVYINGSWECP